MRFSLFALALGLAAIGTSATAAEQPEAQSIVSTVELAVESPQFVPSVMVEFAQANPAWSSLTFHGKRTLGEKGCALVSAFIVAQQAGYTGTLQEFVEELRRLNSFDVRGRIRWDRVSSFAPLFTERHVLKGQAAFDAARAALRNGSDVALQLRTPWTREHWVAAVGLSGDDLIIIDPAGGKLMLLQSTYAIGHLRGITVFHRLPIRLAAGPTTNRSD